MEEKEEKKGFTIRDRRVTAQMDGQSREEVKETTEKKVAEENSSPDLPEMDFSSFIFSLSTSALLHLGEVPDPTTKKREKNLPLAKQTIDILGMLKEKTKGNLTPDEEKLIENILTDLRWRYVREVKNLI